MNIMFHLAELGWKAEDGSTWKVSGYGGITCDAGENTEAYLEYAVTPGRTYKISSVFKKIIALI